MTRCCCGSRSRRPSAKARTRTRSASRFPELFDNLDENLDPLQVVMGELMTWLEGKVTTLPSIEYKGKKITKYLDDEEAREQLFDDGLVFRTDYPVDEKTIADKLKKATTVIDVMKRRKTEEARVKGNKRLAPARSSRLQVDELEAGQRLAEEPRRELVEP